MTIFDSNSIYLDSCRNKSFFKSTSVSPINSFSVNNGKNLKCSKLVQIRKKKESKRQVKFADECGHKLVKVIFMPEKDSFDHEKRILQLDERTPSNQKHSITELDTKINCSNEFGWVTSFIQPGSLYSRFKEELSQNNVKLANTVIEQSSTTSTNSTEINATTGRIKYMMHGVVKALNMCYNKRVFVRISNDSVWSSYSDYNATYRQISSNYQTSDLINGQTVEEFEFDVPLPDKENITNCNSLEFVVGFEALDNGNCYWDNNCNKNYRLDWCFVQNGDNETDNQQSKAATVESDEGEEINLASSPNSHLSQMIRKFPSPYTSDYKPDFSYYQMNYTDYHAWDHFANEVNFY